MANDLTPQLTLPQLKENIDALQKGGMSTSDVQAYVNNYKADGNGGFVLANAKQPSTPSFTDKAFGSAPATGIGDSLVKTTVGEEGVGGLVARPIVAAETAGATADVAQHKDQLAQVTNALLAKIKPLPAGDPRRDSLMEVVRENQGAMGIADDTLNSLQGAQESQEQNLGNALNAGATLASGATGAGSTLAEKLLLSTGMGAAYGAAQPAEKNAGAGAVAEGGALGAVTGAATQGALSGLGALGKYATQELPSSLLTGKLGFTVKQVQNGVNDKATDLILKNKMVGSVASLSRSTDAAMSDLNTKISDALAAHANDTTISLSQAAEDTANRLQKAGWSATAQDVMDAAKGLLGKKPGSSILSSDEADLSATNRLRQGLDAATKPSAFLKTQNPEQTTLAMEFANTLRGVVKTVAPETAPLFDEYAKNITLSHALDKLAAQGHRIRGLRDILGAGLGAFPGMFMGNPILGAAAGVGLERAATSLGVQTGVAVGLDQLGRLAPYLSKLSMPQRLFLMNTLGGTSGGIAAQTPTNREAPQTR